MTSLFAHQKAGIELAKKGNLALFWECGTGKCLTSIEIIKHYGGPALVVAPISIIQSSWMEDIRRFSNLTAVSLHASQSMRRMVLQRKADVYIANYETVKIMFKDLAEKRFQVLIIDESSKVKNPKSQITKAMLAFAGFKLRGSSYHSEWTIPHRYVLSGTPCPNSELELWGQIKIVTGSGSKGFNDNFYAFRGKYFRNIFQGKSVQFQKWVLRKQLDDGSDAKQSLLSAMSPYADVVRKRDALDLPEKVEMVRQVELSPAEQEVYDKMEDDCVVRFADEDVLAVNAISEIGKLRQATSGFMYGSDGTHRVGKTKLDELKDVLAEIGDNQVIIWANFIEEIHSIQGEIGECSTLYGQCPDREKAIDDFKTGKSKYLIANPQSAAHGLNFTNCSYAVYFSLSFSYEALLQSQDRLHRIGQTNKCTYIYLTAKDTIDELIHRVVTKKGEICGETLAWLRAKREGMPHAKAI